MTDLIKAADELAEAVESGQLEDTSDRLFDALTAYRTSREAGEVAVKPLVWVDMGTFLEAENPLGGLTLQAADAAESAIVEAKHIARVRSALA